jgi:hypothetical protein
MQHLLILLQFFLKHGAMLHLAGLGQTQCEYILALHLRLRRRRGAGMLQGIILWYLLVETKILNSISGPFYFRK